MSNYPDTTWEGDPRAPWNQPEPWEGRTCGECRYCKRLRKADGSESWCCAHPDADTIREIDRDDEACEGYE